MPVRAGWSYSLSATATARSAHSFHQTNPFFILSFVHSTSLLVWNLIAYRITRWVYPIPRFLSNTESKEPVIASRYNPAIADYDAADRGLFQSISLFCLAQCLAHEFLVRIHTRVLYSRTILKSTGNSVIIRAIFVPLCDNSLNIQNSRPRETKNG